METKLTSRTETEAELVVTLNEAGLAPIKKHVLDELRGRVKAAGFRPGKAPDAIVERELGSGTVQAEVIDHAIQHSYADAIKAEELPVVAQPQVSLEKFVPYTELEYKVKVELMPKVKLPEYQKMKVKRAPIKIDTAEIDRTIEDLRRREAVRLVSEHPVKKGDEVVFDFEGTKDGQPVKGATATGQTLSIGSGTFIPGFEEELTGLSTGDEKTFDIRFPKEYHEKTLADQVVTFKVKVTKVTDLVLPEVNDEFVAKISPFKTLDELRDDISGKVTGQKAEASAREYEKQVLDQILDASKFKAPEALVNQQLERMRGELEQNLAYSGLNLEKYLELSKKTAEQMDAEMRPEAQRRVGMAMVLTEVAKAEDLKVEPEELETEINRLKSEYPDPKTQAELDNPTTREEVYNHLMASRVIAKLVGYAEGK